VNDTCWVCGGAISGDEARVPARHVPHRLRRFEGKLVHLRCHGEWDGVAPPAVGAKPVAPTRGPLTEGKRLFSEDLAVMLVISPRQARRLLIRLEAKHGVAVVGRTDGRRGPRRFTTAAALEAIGPPLHSSDPSMPSRIADLEVRVERLERPGVECLARCARRPT
jgi:hypothetical protein